MSDIMFEVRQSKFIFTICIVCVCVFEIIGVGGVILALKYFLYNDNKSFDEFTGNIFGLCFSLCVIIAFIILFIYLIINYKKQIDVYTNNKIYRRVGKKIIFEIPYKNIVNIKYGFESVLIFLKNPIVKNNGKKGARNFYAHYSKRDIDKIIHIIHSDYLN